MIEHLGGHGGRALARGGWFLRAFVGFLAGWLRYGKPRFSRLANLFRPKDAVDFEAPFLFSALQEQSPSTLEELADWLGEHTEWVGDPLRGLVDSFPTVKNIEWQLNHGDGVFRNDCDGLALVTALAVRLFCQDPRRNWLVTVVYDPRRVALEASAHVVNLFWHDGKWRIFSNAFLDEEAWDTPCAALYGNSHHRSCCNGVELQYLEVRGPTLEFVAGGLEGSSTLFGCDLTLPPSHWSGEDSG